MKNIVTIVALLLSFHLTITAQDSLAVPLDSQYLAHLADTCRIPSLTAKAVVHYQGYSKAYFEFSGLLDSQAVGYKILAATQGQQVLSDGGEFLLESLDTNELYEITTFDNCNQEVVIATISTYPENPSERGIEVSSRMYQALVAFQKQTEDVPLSQYLEGLTGVSPYEILAFIQQHMFHGAKFDEDEGENLPDLSGYTVGGCNCHFLFLSTQLAVPGTMLPNGDILHDSQDSGGKIPLDDNGKAQYWWASATRGASKWNNIWSDAWLAGNQTYTASTNVINNINSSPYFGQITYNLFCDNYAQLPRECDCTKPLKLYYRYDTQLDAYAKTKNGGIFGWNEKKAFAGSQDMAVVTLRRGSVPGAEVLAAGDARAFAKCNYSWNPEFWVEALDVAGNIASFFVLQGVDSTQLPALIDSLVSSLGDAIQTPFFDSTECDENATVIATLADGCKGCFGDTLVMHPNEEIYLNVFSFSNIMCGGKRSWFSWSRILSDFYAAGIVPGGYLEESERHCCSQRIGTWVLASSEYPVTTQNLKNILGAHFGTNGTWNMPTGPNGVVQIPTEWGRDIVVVAEDCIIEIPGGNLGGGGGGFGDEFFDQRSEKGDDANIATEMAELVAFDISGRIIFHATLPFSKQEAVRHFYQNSFNLPNGTYFLQLKGQKNREIIKVLLSR